MPWQVAGVKSVTFAECNSLHDWRCSACAASSCRCTVARTPHRENLKRSYMDGTVACCGKTLAGEADVPRTQHVFTAK